MRHLIAQGIKQRSLVRTRGGYVGLHANVSRGIHHVGAMEGQGAGDRRISEEERIRQDMEGMGIRKRSHKKAIKPLKFRI